MSAPPLWLHWLHTNSSQVWLRLASTYTHTWLLTHVGPSFNALSYRTALLHCILIIYTAAISTPSLVLFYTSPHLLLMLVHDVALLFIQLVQLLSQPTTALLDVMRGGATKGGNMKQKVPLLYFLHSATCRHYVHRPYTEIVHERICRVRISNRRYLCFWACSHLSHG